MWRGTVALAITLCLTACGGGGGSSGGSPSPATQPTITSAPASISVPDGATATFSVVATGTAPLSYQWRRGAVAIAGATSDRYTTGNTELVADNGAEFSVVVSNAAGSVVSGPARLTVTPVAPVIAAAPEPATVSDGAQASFSVTARGTAPLAYQWLRNGAEVPGATSATFAFAAGLGDSGVDVAVRVSNSVGAVTSAGARLTVNPAAPTITQQPQNVTVDAGGTAVFSVVASGTAPFSYQWQRSTDGGATWTNVLGTQSNIYGVGPAAFANANDVYRVLVTNAVATVPSAAARLTVVSLNRLVAGALGGAGAFDATGTSARLGVVVGNLALLPDGSVLAADWSNHAVRRVTSSGDVSTFVGALGEAGAVDGAVSVTRLMSPAGVAVDAAGTVYVSSSASVRRIANGVVSTLAGSPFGIGSADGAGGSAQFGSLLPGLAVDASGNVLVADTTNHTIRRVTPAGVTTTVAGTAGISGSTDGMGAAARFNSPTALVFDATGNLLIADSGNGTVRRMTPQGVVSTYIGVAGDRRVLDGSRTSARLVEPNGLSFDSAGNLFISDLNLIRRMNNADQVITFSGSSTQDYVDGSAGVSRFKAPSGLVARADGSVVVADSRNYALRQLSPVGAATTLAGLGVRPGAVNGSGAAARFENPCAIVMSPTGGFVVTDRLDYTVRLVAADGAVTTLAGQSGLPGDTDGVGAAARLTSPCAGDFDALGNFWFIDGSAVRRLAPSGAVTTVAGLVNTGGNANGTGAAARFNSPLGLAVNRSSGEIFVADTFNYVVRKVTPAGVVTTFAGAFGQSGSADGVASAARFSNPVGLVLDAGGNLYVAEGTHVLRRISPAGEVTTFAGVAASPGFGDGPGGVARFNGPVALTIDGAGNIFVADTGNSVVRKVTPAGFVSTVIGRRGQRVLQLGRDGNVNGPVSLATDSGGRLYFVSEQAVIKD